MRTFVVERLGADSVPDLLHVGAHAAEFAERLGPYVLKANHGSGMVTYVGEGRTLSIDDLREAEAWLDVDYAWRGLEWAYRGARPLLLAEETLHGADGSFPPPEYKLFTFQGKVEMIQVDMDRFGDHRRLLRRPDWTPLDGALLYPRPDDTDQPCPDTLDLMVAWAAKLGQDLDFIRVDLYDVGERIYVGELTSCPGNGRVRFEPEGLDAWLGGKWRSIPAIS
jgi:TupA-like ATPgrasp